MVKGRLPEEGQLRVGSVTLPTGRLITADYGEGDPVAWATIDPVLKPGTIWAALSEARHQTGLVPILLSGLDGNTTRPWDNGEFVDPVDIRGLDSLDAATVLETMWADFLALQESEEEDADAIQDRAPFSRQFPGLAPPERTQLTPAHRQEVLDSLLPARIGLVAADRPADVLPQIGWTGVTNRYPTALPVAAVLRSWEERFGARLLDVGFAKIRVLVERPPRSLNAANRVAAEHYVLADESGEGLRSISTIAASLVDAPIWALWWD